MKNKIISIILCLCFVFVFAGCEFGGDIADSAKPSSVTEQLPNKNPQINSKPEDTSSKTEIKQEINIPYPLEMYYTSGAGAWYCRIVINSDGSFEGDYHDSDYDKTYECIFRGKFSEPRFVNEYTFALTLEYIEYDGEVGETEVRDDILYEFTLPLGFTALDDSSICKNYMLYTPDAPISMLNEDFVRWSPIWYEDEGLEKLSLYGLRNLESNSGFFTILED